MYDRLRNTWSDCRGRACAAIAIGWVTCTALLVHFAATIGYALTAPQAALVFIADVGFFYVACGTLGLGFRFQRRRAREAAERADLVEARARAVHAEAVATERNRLARDLHDLAAHELMDALLAVRALQIGNDDPALPEIEQKTARALENMRAVVRTLRDDDGRPDPERLPLAEAAARAVDALRTERGMTVDASVAVDGAVDDAVASTVLRTLTETLLNAATHAPGRPVAVSLDADATGVRLTVANPTAPSGEPRRRGGGYGLIGAEERARLLGGRFEVERANGDWIATLHLPASAPEAQPPLDRDPARPTRTTTREAP